MKRQIRRGAFETNSSSTHAINIYHSNNYDIPEEIHVRVGEFGWEYDEYNDPESKLSYLYTYCVCKCKKWEVNEVTGNWESHFDYKLLHDYQYRIKSKLEEAGVKNVIFDSGYDGYIDHSDSLYNSLDEVMDHYFLDFVFNSSSYIETGNDNDGYGVSEDGNAEWSFYKGN